jgi:hypothetical protein
MPVSLFCNDCKRVVTHLNQCRKGDVLWLPCDECKEYLSFDLFSDDRDIKITLQTARLVITRAPHRCASPLGKEHQIDKGTRARFEKALIDGEWGRYWTCLPGIDQFNSPPYA